MMIDPKDIEYEYPEKDNTQGETRRYICDATHVPTGTRARGRGSSGASARVEALAKLISAMELRNG